MNKVENIISVLDNFVDRELQSTTGDLSIIRDIDGSYVFFNKYVIKKEHEYYSVHKKHTFLCKKFAFLKHAVTWCILEYRNKLVLLSRVEDLDRQIEGKIASIQLHKHLVNKTNNIENKILYNNKLTNEQFSLKNLQQEINDLIVETKNWQTQRFMKKTKNDQY